MSLEGKWHEGHMEEISSHSMEFTFYSKVSLPDEYHEAEISMVMESIKALDVISVAKKAIHLMKVAHAYSYKTKITPLTKTDLTERRQKTHRSNYPRGPHIYMHDSCHVSPTLDCSMPSLRRN